MARAVSAPPINFGAGTSPDSWRWAISMATASKTSPSPTKTQATCRSCWAMATGNFSAATNFGVGTAPCSVAVGDFNGDGKQDLAVANLQLNTTCRSCWATARAVSAPPPTSALAISFVSSGGRFQRRRQARPRRCQLAAQASCRSCWAMARAISAPPPTSAADNSPVLVAVGDFNGDGKQDLAVANSNCKQRVDLVGRWRGQFQRRHQLRRWHNPHSVAVGDFNGDGKQDLAVAN